MCAAESFEVGTQVPIIMAVRAWHWFDRERTLQRVDQFLEDNGALIILNSVFRSDSDIAQLTFEVLQTQGIALNPVGSYSSSKLRRNGFPAGWFEEWDQHHLDVIGEWQYDYRLPYDHDAWCGKIRSVSWLADVTEGERIRITEVLRQRLQGHPAMLDVPHQASVVVLRRRRLG
ncbi:hypothetical protein [Paenibacillus guangzhouensis]|uniref:hypothetical protein n=1 Tax=Paenibacillus guangzhouensis TaxID=1473112 RepID=UPI001D1111B0|nr:hypothetical protein [Paenibacillus guangzhouensis]